MFSFQKTGRFQGYGYAESPTMTKSRTLEAHGVFLTFVKREELGLKNI